MSTNQKSIYLIRGDSIHEDGLVLVCKKLKGDFEDDELVGDMHKKFCRFPPVF